ncbi:MAG: SusD/RagB family nutrient-binding outer membrane lipoprotein [Dysgonamonadaceae bacterium]|jgi:hypothetical protein|nr:SusD/RagB family nutrient-binding outer membrane lipoprotein [Dysgonamonadaceae bacterium]
MNTKYKYLFLLIFSLIGTSACNDFDKINESPNDSKEPEAQAIMSSILRNAVSLNFIGSDGTLTGGAHLHERIHNINWDYYSQYMDLSGNGWSPRNYIPADAYNSDYWDGSYQWLRSANSVILYSKDNNLTQLARIWRVYIESRITDYFGHVPFPGTDCLERKNLDTEFAFKNQADIYDEFFSELTDAASKIDPSKPGLSAGDIYYSGDMAKWYRFANTLHLRLALRISEVDPDKAKKEAKKALQRGTMQSGDDLQMPATDGWGNQYNYTMYQINWGEKMLMTKSMENILIGLGGMAYDGTATQAPPIVDPRGSLMFDPSVEGGKWEGIVPGLPTDEHAGQSINYAYLGKAVVGTTEAPNSYRKLDAFLYTEACFLRAEAYHRWPELGNAKNAYNDGISASFAQWGIAGKENVYIASIDKNVNGTSVAYDDQSGAGNSALEKIITQKYIAGYPDGSLEAWNDKRRLNLPNLLVPKYKDPSTYSNTDKDPTKSANFIKRMIYPAIEQTINNDKYSAGIDLYSSKKDATSSNMWWDTNANYNTSTYKYTDY